MGELQFPLMRFWPRCDKVNWRLPSTRSYVTLSIECDIAACHTEPDIGPLPIPRNPTPVMFRGLANVI